MQAQTQSSVPFRKSENTLFRRPRLERFGRLLLLGVVLLGLVLGFAPAQAQTYRFAVPLMQMQVFIQPDGSAKIVYDITFENSTSGDPIDIVDIGMPTNSYDLNAMSASSDGVALDDIRPSTVVKQGVEIHLAGQAIAPGQTGILHFETLVPDLVFQDVTKRDYASMQITPTWFDGQSVIGDTNLQIAIHVPEGISPDELLFQDEPFSNKALFEGRAVAVWDLPAVSLTGPHIVGLSYPKRVMTNIQAMSVWKLASIWLEQHPNLRIGLGVLAIGLFSFFFLRLSGGTGFSLWFILCVGLGYLFLRYPLSLPAAILPLIGLVVWTQRSLNKRKVPYLPPIAQVEGGGIKRGLTAPEAAALLDMPLNKILTLVFFGLLKKGVVRQTKEEPLVLEVAEGYRAIDMKGAPKDRFNVRQRAAQQAGVTLQSYEQRFLDELERHADSPVKDIKFGEPMEWFLTSLAKRMKGFDLSDTQDYYRSIVKKAMDQAKALGDIPARDEALDRDMEWILLDDGYPQVFNTPTYTYHPSWTRPVGGGSSAPGLPSSGSGSSFSPSVSNVTAGFAGWTENTMASLATSISPSMLPSLGGKTGFVNLSGVDRTVGNVFEALGSSSGKGGGGGGGCACAGCACACACAGGGR